MNRFVDALFGAVLFLAGPASADTTAAEYRNQANAEREHGSLDTAINDYNKAIELNSADGNTHLLRGATYFQLRRWTEALSDFRRACELSPETEQQARLFIWATRAQMGEKKDANKELSEYVDMWKSHEQVGVALPTSTIPASNFDSAVEPFRKGPTTVRGISKAERLKQRSDWPLTIANFLRGKISESEFFLNDPPPRYTNGVIMPNRPAGTQSCSAWFYAGLKRLVDGDRKTALEYFRKASTADANNKLDREFARSELNGL
jgi:tetratricopeptide (TPR) repeat protein